MYDRTAAYRSRVLDDQEDYFSTDNEEWLDPEELAKRRKAREEAQAARDNQRSTLKLTLDFAGRRVVETNDDDERKHLDARFGATNRPSVAEEDAQIEAKLARELDEIEQAKALSLQESENSNRVGSQHGNNNNDNNNNVNPSSSSDASSAAPAMPQSNSAKTVVPARGIKPSDNILLRPELAALKSSKGKEKSKNSQHQQPNEQTRKGMAKLDARRVQHSIDIE